MEKYELRDKITGYVTNEDNTSEDAETHLTTGSQNVLIDPRFGRFGSRGGYSRLGAENTSLTPVRQALTWNTSTGTELPLRWYDDELEVYLGTVDGVDVDAWTRVASGLSTTAIPRATTWWDTAENLDKLLWVEGTDNILEWSGMVTTIASATTNTITKNGTDTWAEARATTAGTTQVTINGTVYTYTGGESTTTLTGVTPDPSSEAADSVAIQTHVANDNQPTADRLNNYIFEHENQIWVGSDSDSEILVSKNTSFTDYTFSSPRLSGEGALLALDGPTKGFGVLSRIPVVFSGNHSIFTAEFFQLDVGGTLTETLKVKKLKTGVNQGAFNQESIVPIGDSLVYLTNEPTLRMLETVDIADQPQLKSLSNPIKPDFDAETWTNAFGMWHRNRYLLSSPTNSKLYILEFQEDANGKLRRFWQPPQILPVRAMSIIGGALYIHSNGVPETYLPFNGLSDGVYDGIDPNDKLPINAIAVVAYRTFGERALLKNFDEFYVEGNISASTPDLDLTLAYDFEGAGQELVKTIDGTNQSIILESLVATSLGQQPLGTQPLGGSVQEPPSLARFRVIFEIPKEDFHEIRETYSTNEVDRAWEILSAGGNIKLSPRKDIAIKI